jgi:hypothetical protein
LERKLHEENMSWMKSFQSTRSLPLLWVEQVWLLASKDSASLIREISLRPGMNVVWAEEPADDGATGRKSAGHGVGKTSFCLLLRYALCDESEGINTLRSEVQRCFPEGGVAALVHLGEETWTVFRPFSSYRQSIAARSTELDTLLSVGENSEFDAYRKALHTTFVQSLPISTMPGSGQELEWRHILAWCARDQRTRFDSFFHWRAGEGVGFRRGKQDPPLLVKAVLGILDVEAAQILSEIEATEHSILRMEERYKEVEREPVFNLNRVEGILRRLLSVDDSVAMESVDLFQSSVMSLLEIRLTEMAKAEGEFDFDIEVLDGQRQAILQKLGNARDDISILNLEKQRLAAQLAGNQKEYTRLTNEIAILRNRKGRCELGDIEFSDCQHIQVRLIPTIAIQRVRDERALVAAKAECEKALAELDRRLNPILVEVELAERQANSLQQQSRRLEMRRATSALERASITEMKEEYRERKCAHESGKTNAELVTLSEQKKALIEKKQSLLLKSEVGRSRRSSRVSELASITGLLAERLLDTNATGWFDERSDETPFRLQVGGEAYHVMEVLLGDIVCMVDALVNASNKHPAFLVHDCPREADMGAHLYRDFLEIVREIDEHFGRNGAPCFQYILTTTSPPPKPLQETPYLRLTLRPGSDDELLFRRQLTQQTAELIG